MKARTAPALCVLIALLVVGCDRNRASHAQATPAMESPASGDTVSNEPVLPTPPPERAAVVASAPVTDSGMSFTDMDKNMDGGVTRDELAHTETLFHRFNDVDTSGDGQLSLAEIERFRSDMAGVPKPVMTDSRSFTEMDRNADGRLTHDELDDAEMLERHFGEADADQDGSLSAAEVDAHRSAMASGK